MDHEAIVVDANFPLFSQSLQRLPPLRPAVAAATIFLKSDLITPVNKNPTDNTAHSNTQTTFADIGLAGWAVDTCKELGMRMPTPVQTNCIPNILVGRDVLGLAQTGSGKTAAFALPILYGLAEDLYGVFALIITPTRELAYQLAEQFRALVVGGWIY